MLVSGQMIYVVGISELAYIVDCKVYLYFEIQLMKFGLTPATDGTPCRCPS